MLGIIDKKKARKPMHSFTELFADFCEKNLDLIQTVNYHYESLSACILDCVCAVTEIVDRRYKS